MELQEFESLCEKQRQSLRAYVYTCCRDLPLTEDIVQETMLVAIQKRDRYFPEANFGAWLISIARNVWYQVRDRKGIEARAMKYIEENATLFFDQAWYEEAPWDEERKALTHCVKLLNRQEQHLIREHFVNNRQYSEIAKTLKQKISWVKVRMFRLRTALQECVRRYMTLNSKGNVHEG